MEDLTEKELAIFQELFNRIDVEGDGEFSFRELGIVMRALGGNVSDGELQDMINESDTNGTGSLDIEEFVNTLLRKLSDTDRPDDLKMAFSLIDKDRNGCISTNDLRKLFGSIGIQPSDEELEEIIRSGDVDQDGVLIFEEFVGILTSER
ncbi:PREDICTED: calmodulin [Drosophila arizonae]|uniref:Calmodulin n=1 Tax=Drosophila arizonae TaxID=7263 RepID=A0ABM1PKY1_DROAR|nr:PREDICTED: calmodulin [Drosophila arizonae]